MATLRPTHGGTSTPLASRVLLGRSSSCALRLTDPRVSGEHATLVWDGLGWSLRDLGSRNGSYVDGERLEPGASRAVGTGSRIALGGPDGGWVLIEDGPPAPMAECGERMVVAEAGLLALPDGSAPEVVIYADGRGSHVGERDGEVFAVNDGDELEVGGERWTLRVPATLEGTATVDAGLTLDTVQLELAVSADEEHVEIQVHGRGRSVQLEAREHSYILLTLARARLRDAGEPLVEQGWLDRDQLLKMLGLDTNALNVGIHRARAQLAAAGVDGAAGIVEVRRGKRRFGVEPDRFSVRSL